MFRLAGDLQATGGDKHDPKEIKGSLPRIEAPVTEWSRKKNFNSLRRGKCPPHVNGI